MPAVALAVRTAQVTVENQDRHVKTPHFRARTFGASEKLFKQHLMERECFGIFRLLPSRAVSGHSDRQGIRLVRVEPCGKKIRLTIQPSSSNTAWEYCLLPPLDGMDIKKLYEILDAPVAPKVKVEPVVTLVPTPDPEPDPPAELASLVIEPEPPAVVESPAAFANDVTVIVVALSDVFSTPDERCDPAVVKGALQDALGWSPELACQAYRALLAREHLCEGHNGYHQPVVFLSESLRDAFKEFGIHKEPERSDNAMVTQLPIPVVRRRQVRTTVPATPPVAETPSLTSTFGLLENRAAQHATARQGLLDSHETRNKLVERRQVILDRLEAEKALLAQVDQEMAEMEEQRDILIGIMSNPEYSEAASKIAQIQAIMK